MSLPTADRPRCLAVTLAAITTLACTALAQPLPRTTPEAAGVDSGGILRFLQAAEKGPHEFHSLVLVRHGNVVAEGWWAPYRADLKHMMYSVSKSFTSTAVGFAVQEDLLKLDEPVLQSFPDFQPAADSTHLKDLTIRHLLTMSAGQDPDPSGRIWATENWEEAFLQTPIVKAPGSTFLYNSTATYMLSAIVRKASGQTVFDFLTPRFFQPLGITDVDWETSPNGNSAGGWGLRIRTEDMAKLGLLLLQKGVWNGESILDPEWVEAATSAQIIQNPNATPEQLATSDWLQGYGFQLWRCRNGGFRADGAFGQYIIVLPDNQAVIAITSSTPDMQGILNLVWEHLLPAMHPNPLPQDETTLAQLQETLAALALPIPQWQADSPTATQIAGAWFELEPNPIGLDRIRFDLNPEQQPESVTFQYREATYTIPMNRNQWAHSKTARPGPSLTAGAQNSLKGLAPFEVAAAYRWSEPHTLELTLRYVESPHTEVVTARFGGDRINLAFAASLLGSPSGAPLQGVRANLPTAEGTAQ
jgi:CubicO group peptidase (beta-lactamase class C family)